MKMLFGYVNQEDAEMMEQDGCKVFYNDYGTAFDFQVVVSEEGITIEDTIGRLVPMSHSDALALLNALKDLKGLCKTFSKVQMCIDDIDAGKTNSYY